MYMYVAMSDSEYMYWLKFNKSHAEKEAVAHLCPKIEVAYCTSKLMPLGCLEYNYTCICLH